MISLRSAFCCIVILFLSASFTSQSSLYSAEDPLYELNSSNFREHVFEKNNAWVIEFYNSWCGHCIRFAPIWKEFAREIQTWKNVVDVGVVNCNEKENTALCRQYDVQLFPTIKFFWHHVNETDIGKLYTGSRGISAMQSGVVKFLEDRWDEGIPPTWPNFAPIEEEDLQHFIENMSSGNNYIWAFAEPPDSYLGRKIILDLSSRKHHLLKRVLSSSPLLNELQSHESNETVPALFKINRDGSQELIRRFTKEDNDTVIRDAVFKIIEGEPRKKQDENFVSTETSSPEPFVLDNVYMSDLENAVYYSLNQEVGVSKIIEGEKISTLKAYLNVLKTYFPGSNPVMDYLSKLHSWITYRKPSITGEEFVRTVEKTQGGNNILRMKDWVGCKGSEAKYRGYPCSLWTLFHTLTVQADKKVKESKDGAVKNTGEVLFVIRDYVENFFTCEDCANHFLKMAENVQDQVKTTEEAVLWLWRAHNHANHRLAGDLTEDPKHPKIQFPSPEACPKCRRKEEGSNEDVWNKAEVLRYLHEFYGTPNILTLELEDQDKNALALDKSPTLEGSGMAIRLTQSYISILLVFFTCLINSWI